MSDTETYESWDTWDFIAEKKYRDRLRQERNMTDKEKDAPMNQAIKEAHFRQHERLRGGKGYSIDEQYQLLWQKGYDAGRAARDWIPVAERLPDSDGRYFVVGESDGHIETGIRHYVIEVDGTGWWVSSDQRIIAWMPIPPYTPASDGENAIEVKAMMEAETK